jgi:hypothetical protein
VNHPRPDGTKGSLYRPDRCQHAPDDGCEWCCQTCNHDRHLCPGCGTNIGHNDGVCPDCVKLYELNR